MRATPRARRPMLIGGDERFVAKVAAPPVDGAANEAVTALLADAFGVGRRAVTLVAGDKSREKRFLIAGNAEALAIRAANLYGAGA